MIQKKICLLGAHAVGKTSLIQQFISSMFSDKYLTTVGVKVDKKILAVGDTDMTLMVWDLAGEDDYSTLQTSYLRGAAGYILVMDGTRPASVDVALSMHERTTAAIGNKPCVLAFNKADLADQWSVPGARMDELGADFTTFRTSAKTGENVEAMFNTLAEAML